MSEDIDSVLDRNKIMCPVCLDVLIEPVTLVCTHEMCKPCYDEYFEKSNFYCPLCKKRLSSWARKAAANGSLVNKCKWNYLKENFSDLIEKRLKGEDNIGIFQPNHQVCLAKNGEIHKEYLQEKRRWEAENKAIVDKEEAASFILIQKILKEENEEIFQEKQRQIEQDEELAKVISKQLNCELSPNSVGKKLLRSVTTSSQKKNTTYKNSIKKYCVQQSSIEKENKFSINTTKEVKQSTVKNKRMLKMSSSQSNLPKRPKFSN